MYKKKVDQKVDLLANNIYTPKVGYSTSHKVAPTQMMSSIGWLITGKTTVSKVVLMVISTILISPQKMIHPKRNGHKKAVHIT